MQKKVETAVSSLSKAREVQRKHLDTIKSLEKELSTIEIERIAFEEKIAEESISQGKNIVLEESQV